MTTLDMVPTVDELLEDFRRSALQRRLHPSLPVVPMIHLGVVTLFSLLCLGLVR
jgi:hypothetical protein